MSTDDTGLELGLVIYASVKPIFKIYFIIALGFWLARRNILTVTTCRDISDTIVTAIMPCLIFDNIVSNLKSSDIKNIGIIFFTGTLLFLVGCIMGWITYMVTKSPRRWLGGLLSVGLFPNISDLPIAYLQTFAKGDVIFTAAEGNKGVAYVCIFLMSQVFYQFSLGLYRLIEWDFKDEIKQKQQEEDDEEAKEMINMEREISTHDLRPLPRISLDQESISSEAEERQSIRDYKPMNTSSSEENIETTHSRNELSPVSTSRIERSVSPLLEPGLIRRRSRRGSQTTSESNILYALTPTLSRTMELRKSKSQMIDDVIQEYSNFEGLKRNETRRSVAGTSEIGIEPVSSEEDTKPTFKSQVLRYLQQMGKNLIAPSSVSLVVSIAIAMSPPLKALFVPARVHIPPAPDGQPPLSFIIDLTSYIGAASVPLGLILLGATISRLQVKKMPQGFWKTAVMITASRLILIPIIGVGLTTGFYKGGWYGDDKLIRFVSVLEFGLPNATALVYFTAFYTDPTAEEHLQMDCLAICLICQYSILYITLPFLVTFTLKVSLGL